MFTLAPIIRCLTELDHVRLQKILNKYHSDALAELLDAADTVPSSQIAPDIVTMYSQVIVCDVTSGEAIQMTVCYPDDAEPNQGFVSVLSPVGTALLGQPVGALVTTMTPTGHKRPLRIEAILFQPEASGDHLT